MRNLYWKLGFRNIVDDPEAIARALKKGGLPSSLREQGLFVLLQPARKARYDWALEKAMELAGARERLGLPLDAHLVEPETGSIAPNLGSHSDPTGLRHVWLGIAAMAAFGLLAWAGASAFRNDSTHRASPDPLRGPQTSTMPRRALNPSVEPSLRAPAGKLHPIPPPDHGWTQGEASLVLKVPWRIETDPGQDYLLRLLDAKSHAVVMTVFLRGGEPFLGRAPEGEFEFTYASGQEWFGLAEGFGPEARVARSERIHRISLGPDETWAWELQLHPTSGEGARIDPVGPVEADSGNE